jgi:transcriptional regulator with XRE-family HTH domain
MIGAKVKQLRQNRGLTLEQLSKISGISRSSISELENNISSPTAKTVSALAKALGVEEGDLFK